MSLTEILQWSFFNSALGKNITFVRPEYFIIRAFTGIPNVSYYFVFLFFVYVVAVLGNTLVMVVICLDHNLKTPKYVAVFNLAFADLFSSTTLLPKVFDIFLFNHHYIPYNDCLMFIFFCYTSFPMQAFNLMALCYDRLIAIMYPLHYQVKVTNTFMLSLIASFWVFAIILVLITVGLVTRLSFCKSVVINSYFCDHREMFPLACNDYFPNYVLAHVLVIVILWLPLTFILFSYACIGYALSKVSTVQERLKALKTCTAHLLVVAIYFLPVLITYTFYSERHPKALLINLTMTSVFSQLLNPIIYVLQTQEVKESVKKLLKIGNNSRITVKKVTIK